MDTLFTPQEKSWMQRALELAQSAQAQNEVPVGALLIHSGQIIAEAHNLRESLKDPSAHAEILALREAASLKQSWRLSGATLVVSLEPCLMCAGALYQARIAELIFAAWDPKGGAMGSLYHVHQDLRLNHKIKVRGGLFAAESKLLLQDFFVAKRKPRT